MKAWVASLLLAGSQLSFAVPADLLEGPHREVELVGVVGTRPFVLHGRVEDGTVLKLLAPIDLTFPGHPDELKNVLDIVLHAWSDPALHEMGRLNGKLVRVQCVVAPDSFLGYRHASCSPRSIEVLPTTFKPN